MIDQSESNHISGYTNYAIGRPTEKQIHALHLDEVSEEYEVLEPFKAFLEVPCEICHEPVKEWDDYNVNLAIEGIGCGHTSCWNSELGRFIELRKAIEKVEK